MIAAVVPVAFFTPEHVEMTSRFLTNLCPEVETVGVWHNGGPYADQGRTVLERAAVELFDAEGWPFYRMWNRGIAWARDGGATVCLVLNNDIEWEPGALWALGEALEASEPDVTVVSPSPGGEPRHAFAIRPGLAPEIDERYLTWFGDTELEYRLKKEGYRLVHFDPGIRHPHKQTTSDHLPNVHDLRLQDQRLYASRWE